MTRTFATTTQPFPITLQGGTPFTLFAYRLLPSADFPSWAAVRDFAVHRSLNSRRSDDWVVTHLPTGLTVNGYADSTAREAVQEAAKRLFRVGPDAYRKAVERALPSLRVAA